MKMKDKLVKTHHSANYYHVKRFSLAFLVALSCAAIIAIPTYTVLSHEASEEAAMTYAVDAEINEAI